MAAEEIKFSILQIINFGSGLTLLISFSIYNQLYIFNQHWFLGEGILLPPHRQCFNVIGHYKTSIMMIRILLIFFSVWIWGTSCSQNNSTQFTSPNFLDSVYIRTIDNVVKPLGWTSDYAELYTKEQIQRLDTILADFENKTGIEIAILTTNADLSDSLKLDKFSLHILNTWGVGKTDKKNGILIVIAPESRRLRIQNGYGIEEKLTDIQTKFIIDSIFTPNFKEGKFYEGTLFGIQKLQETLKKNGL